MPAHRAHMGIGRCEKNGTLLDLCVSSLRRGHANLLCVVPILTDDPRRESEMERQRKDVSGEVSDKVLLGKEEFQSMKFSPCPAKAC